MIKKISFCITCMNRLGQIQATLPANLSLARDADLYEFVLLDYNSKDGLGEWVASNFKTELSSGLLSYYRTEEPEIFNMPHAKNVAHLLGSSEIISNLDADNKLSSAYLRFLTAAFKQISPGSMVSFNASGMGARISVFRQDFIAFGGYDEELIQRFGTEDANLLLRLYYAGIKSVSTLNTWMFGEVMDHDDDLRLANSDLEMNRDQAMFSGTSKTLENLRAGKFVANQGRIWGRAIVTKNFGSDRLEISSVI